MHIVTLAWIYVVGLMALTQHSVIAGIVTFLAWCALPLALIFYIGGSRKRRQRRLAGQEGPMPERGGKTAAGDPAAGDPAGGETAAGDPAAGKTAADKIAADKTEAGDFSADNPPADNPPAGEPAAGEPAAGVLAAGPLGGKVG